MKGQVTATVMLIDQDAAARERAAEALGGTPLGVLGLETARAFFSAVTPGAPCAVIDSNLADMTCHQLQAEVSRRALRVPLLFLVNQNQGELAISLIKAGAADVLVKPVDADELRRRILRVLASAEREKARVRAARERLEQLTERELQVVMLATSGRSNKDIAQQLSISFRTVELHRRNAMRKTRTKNLVELTHFLGTARREDLAGEGPPPLQTFPAAAEGAGHQVDSGREATSDQPASSQLPLSWDKGDPVPGAGQS